MSGMSGVSEVSEWGEWGELNHGDSMSCAKLVSNHILRKITPPRVKEMGLWIRRKQFLKRKKPSKTRAGEEPLGFIRILCLTVYFCCF